MQSQGLNSKSTNSSKETITDSDPLAFLLFQNLCYTLAFMFLEVNILSRVQNTSSK